MRKAWLIIIFFLFMLLSVIISSTARSQECILDMSETVITFGFDGTNHNFNIRNLQFLGQSFSVNWGLNLLNGDWEIIGIGRAITGTGGLIDFSSASVNFSNCMVMVINNFQFFGQSFTACWRLNTDNGNWNLIDVGDICVNEEPINENISIVTICTRDSDDGNVIFGVSINLENIVSHDRYRGVTDLNGCDVFDDIPYGIYNLTASAQNCNQTMPTSPIRINEQEIEFLIDLFCSQTEEYNIVLTWGSDPRDLDAHLLVPPDSDNPEGFNVNFANRGNLTMYPYAALDIDDVNGYGPEKITISSLIEGRYRYYVDWYAFDSNQTWAFSQANVTLFLGNSQIRSWDVSNWGRGRYWVVFDILSDGSIIEYNSIQSSEPTVHDISTIFTYFNAQRIW